jgi:Adenosine deaminase
MTTMTEARISIPGLLCVWLLSNRRLMSNITPSGARINIRETLYDCYHAWLTRSPDHVFNNAWKLLNFQTSSQHVCLQSLEFLKTEFLIQRHQRWYVRPEALGAWQQGLCSRMSQLPLMAWVRAAHLPVKPHSEVVEDYLRHEGLHETHVHLNGSSHAERAWLHALERPLESIKEFSKAFNKPVIRDLVRSVDESLSPFVLRERLRTARLLRQHLMRAAGDDRWWLLTQAIDTQEACGHDDKGSFNVDEELRWQTAFLEKCRAYPGHYLLPEAYHQYLLLLNQYYQLTVQNEQHVGFDQFQKNADVGLREDLESDYFERFKDAHGFYSTRSRVQYYEGRFAPKDDLVKLHKLLLQILQGYHRYLSNLLPKNHPNQSALPPHQMGKLLSQLEVLGATLHGLSIAPLHVALVCHFIKRPWSRQDQKFAPYRYYSLVGTLSKQANVLLRLLKRYPRLRQWIRGIDGAANELHAPPEYFAPIFRQCEAFGLTHKTFHAGEDFPHLLSGLRYMLEALELLDLRAGDRLGHGTAMGIAPKLWIDRMPQTIIISRGDWFLSVLAAWRLMCMQPIGLEKVAHTLTAELGLRSVELFGQHLNPYECEQAMGLRSLSLPEVYRWVNNGRQFPIANPMIENSRKEMVDVHSKATANQKAFEVYWQWQSDKGLWKKSEELIEVKSDFLQASHYLLLQQSLMQEVADRGVVIETLPSSNVRISQYKHFSEHHALRWMKAPAAAQPNDPDILVSLGSDDPGIFSTDIETEFHHLFIALKNSNLTEAEALQRVAQVNERGRIYRFHPK